MKIFIACLFVLSSLAFEAQARAYQSFTSEVTETPLFELFLSEADPELGWAEIASRNAAESDVLTLEWHLDWLRAPGWIDERSMPESDRRQQHLTDHNSGVRYSPQGFVQGKEWRGIFGGDPIPKPARARMGVLNVDVERDGPLVVTFEPGPDFRFKKHRLNAHVAFMGDSEYREITRGPAKNFTYTSRAPVLEHHMAEYDAEIDGWRFEFERRKMWPVKPRNAAPNEPDPKTPSLIIWIEPANQARPIQAVAGQIKPKPKRVPLDADGNQIPLDENGQPVEEPATWGLPPEAAQPGATGGFR